MAHINKDFAFMLFISFVTVLLRILNMPKSKELSLKEKIIKMISNFKNVHNKEKIYIQSVSKFVYS